MKRTIRRMTVVSGLALSLILINSCESLLNPEQELYITEDRLYDDWYEYRSIEMGLYGLQQQLVEQLLILGELRGDLLTITDNADPDMVEIYNFNVSKSNKYASPSNFFRLISACNNFIRFLEIKHPEVLDHAQPVNNYDRLYGEALTMRAWAYFNAVRIYGKMPFIPASLTTLEEVVAFVNSAGTYTDSVHIVFGKDSTIINDGYYQADTTLNYELQLEKQFYDETMVINHFTDELETKIKAVGVNHYIDNNDNTWEVTIWTDFGLHALLGHMYLTVGDYQKADQHFKVIMYNNTETLRYRLDNSFAYTDWKNIFTNIDAREHIYVIWFNKANFQQNRFQEFFEPWAPHKYMMKPSYTSIKNWESQWRYQVINVNQNNKARSKMGFPGIPSDFFRGIGSSYMYTNGSVPITQQQYMEMIYLRADGDDRNSRTIMENMDTIVYKYSINKSLYDQDANYIIYRAAGIQLYAAENFIYWAADHLNNGNINPQPIKSIRIVNDGSNYSTLSNRDELGVRGRVDLGRDYDGIKGVSTDYWYHDPYTNKIIGYKNYSGNFLGQQMLIEEEIIRERALELAFEGERFYDLMRFAKRRNDPSFLATRVASKYPAERRQEIENLLMNEENWYINWFD